MPVGREAVTLPLLLLTVAALGGVRVAQGGALALVPPSLMSLILATVLVGALVRSRALVPGRLVNDQRTPLENSSGVVVLVSLLAATRPGLHARHAGHGPAGVRVHDVLRAVAVEHAGGGAGPPATAAQPAGACLAGRSC